MIRDISIAYLQQESQQNNSKKFKQKIYPNERLRRRGFFLAHSRDGDV